MELRTPIVYGEPIYETDFYKLVVGAMKEDDLPQYVVLSKANNVVEFTNEVLYLAKDWIRYFTKKLGNFDKPEEIEDVPPGVFGMN